MDGPSTALSPARVRRGRAWLPIAFTLLAASSHLAYAQEPDRSGSVEGFIQDARGAAIAGASVSLQTESRATIKTISTDQQGAFRFVLVDRGRYTLRAHMAAYDEASFGSFAIGHSEVKKINLILKATEASAQGAKASAMPEFSDAPNFTVAGVVDPTSLGGHGSNTLVRNRETLAKEAVSLGGESPDTAQRRASFAEDERPLLAELERNPRSYEANYYLGKLLVSEGKAGEAIRYLEQATQLKPGVYENEYELVLAYTDAGDYKVAAAKAHALLAQQDRADLHHLLGEVEERRNNPLEAVRQYERAAELDATEPNLFDWGAELLLHQAPQPAIEVLSKGSGLFPSSVRMRSALGAAWYVRGSYDQAVQMLCQASDLDPNATIPYLFMGRIQNVEAGGNTEILTRLERFARLQPANALANFYYAVSLWKQRKSPEDNQNLAEIESRLTAAVRLDPQLGAAYLQLGILYSERKNSPAAIAAYRKAVESAPELPDAHYRLAQAYRQSGEKLKAQQELELYDRTSKKQAGEVERERHEIRQFVYTLRDQTSTDQTSASRPQ